MNRKVYRKNPIGYWIFFLIAISIVSLITFLSVQDGEFTIGQLGFSLTVVIISLLLLIRSYNSYLSIDNEELIVKTFGRKEVVFIKEIKDVIYFYDRHAPSNNGRSKGYFEFIDRMNAKVLRLNVGRFSSKKEIEFIQLLHAVNPNIQFDEECTKRLNGTYDPHRELIEIMVGRSLTNKQARRIKLVLFSVSFLSISLTLTFMVIKLIIPIVQAIMSIEGIQ